ncbi:MAG: DUF1631 family protein [Thiobacillus sp.]
MSIPPVTPPAAALLDEAETRMAQALDNFFQRSRTAILDTLARAISAQMTPSMLATGQTCLDWLNLYPDALSSAFADQFRQQLSHPETIQQPAPVELQLVDDAHFGRQLAENKAAAKLSEALRPEMRMLFSRLPALHRDAEHPTDSSHAYEPLAVVQALSRALDSLDLDTQSGTLLLQHATAPLCDSLKQTYIAINQYLDAQGVAAQATQLLTPVPFPRRAGSTVGQDILAHLQSVVSQSTAAAPQGGFAQPGASLPVGSAGLTAHLPHFLDRLTHWQTLQPAGLDFLEEAPALLLRQLQQDARHTDAGPFDLAVLDAVAALFEFILDDPDISPRYTSAIAQLQIPVLRVALASPDFFSDDDHPTHQTIDLLGHFSRRFPENHSAHSAALAQVEAACTHILDAPDHQTEAFTQALDALKVWLADEEAHTEADLSLEVDRLEQIERQELGTLLALENLSDLTARYPAPESVLRRLEAAWLPYMASLYVAEAGEGPIWRAAGTTLLELFLSLQAPENEDERETRLQSIPRINAELRRGLQAQGADSTQLKSFFSAITATQECWIRPALGHQETLLSTFKSRHTSLADIDSHAPHGQSDTLHDDVPLQQARQLQEGDWVDFDPPYEDLSTARVAWVGTRGYLLFCDSEGEQRFSLDCDRLADEIRAGRAQIPELSVTRKAMLRLKTHLSAHPNPNISS